MGCVGSTETELEAAKYSMNRYRCTWPKITNTDIVTHEKYLKKPIILLKIDSQKSLETRHVVNYSPNSVYLCCANFGKTLDIRTLKDYEFTDIFYLRVRPGKTCFVGKMEVEKIYPGIVDVAHENNNGDIEIYKI